MIAPKALQHVRMFPSVHRLLLPKVLNFALGCAAYRVTPDFYKYGSCINYLYSGKPVIFACSAPNVVRDADYFSISTSPRKYTHRQLKLTDEQKAELAEKGKAIIRSDYDYNVIGRKGIAALESL